MTEEIKQWGLALSGLLTPALAIFGGYIGWRQHQTARTKLRLELFEKRYAVYTIIAHCLAEALQQGDADPKLQLEFLRGTKETLFLFDPEISSFTDLAYKRLVKLHHHEEQIKRSDGSNQEEHLRLRQFYFDYLQDELMNLQKKFEPWLGFAKVK